MFLSALLFKNSKIIESDFCVRYTAIKLMIVMESGRITQNNPVTGAVSVGFSSFQYKRGGIGDGKIYFVIGPGHDKLKGNSLQ